MAPCSLRSHSVETRNLAVRTARQVSPGLPAAAACFSDLPGELPCTGGQKGWASAAIRVCVSCTRRTWATHTPRARSWPSGAAFPWTSGLVPTAGRDARHGDHGPWEDSEGEKVDGACGGSAVGLRLPGGGGGLRPSGRGRGAQRPMWPLPREHPGRPELRGTAEPEAAGTSPNVPWPSRAAPDWKGLGKVTCSESGRVFAARDGGAGERCLRVKMLLQVFRGGGLSPSHPCAWAASSRVPARRHRQSFPLGRPHEEVRRPPCCGGVEERLCEAKSNRVGNARVLRGLGASVTLAARGPRAPVGRGWATLLLTGRFRTVHLPDYKETHVRYKHPNTAEGDPSFLFPRDRHGLDLVTHVHIHALCRFL